MSPSAALKRALVSLLLNIARQYSIVLNIKRDSPDEIPTWSPEPGDAASANSLRRDESDLISRTMFSGPPPCPL